MQMDKEIQANREAPPLVAPYALFFRWFWAEVIGSATPLAFPRSAPMVEVLTFV